MQESSASVLQMSCVYSRIKAKFDNWSKDSHLMLQGIDLLEDCTCVHKDEVWRELLDSDDATDVLTQELLQLLFEAFSKTTQRLLLDHLPGGLYNSVTDGLLVEETASVPTTNVAPERDFAVLDRMLREKPNARLVALESMILYSNNKTSLWLDKKTKEEKKTLLQAACTLAPVKSRKFKERRRELEAKREEALVQKQHNIARKDAKLKGVANKRDGKILIVDMQS